MPSSEESREIRLIPVEGCFEDPPEGIQPFDVECIPLQDFSPGDMQPGGRILLVTPYVEGIQVCSGQYAQFQVLQGMGGQINNALYLGSSVAHVPGNGTPHELEVPVDCDDTINHGEKGLAIRDKGRWYVVKLAQSVEEVEPSRAAVVYGGNKNPYDGDTMDSYKVAPYRPWVFPRYKPPIMFEEFGLTDEWYDLHILPEDFEWGDEFSAVDDHTLPFGFGWAQLDRGNSIEKYTWDAGELTNYYAGDDNPDDDSPTILVAFINPDDKDQIIVCMSEGIGGGPSDTDGLSISTTSETDLSISSATSSGAPAGNSFLINLSREVDFEAETLRLSIGGSVVEDADGNGNSSARVYVYYNEYRWSFVPVVNMTATPVIRGQKVTVVATTIEYTIDDVTVEWFKMYGPGIWDQFSMKVLGGNTLDSGVTSYPNAIKQLYTFANPSDWQDFNQPTVPDPSEDMDGGDLDNETPDGYGWLVGDPPDAIFGEASTWHGRMEIAHNRHVGKFVVQDDVVLTMAPAMLYDDKEEQEYRVVWDIFA